MKSGSRHSVKANPATPADTAVRAWVAPASALIAAATALASLISALTPDMAWRGHVVKDMGLVQVAAVFHAAVVPMATALLLTSYYLWRRRRRAFTVALVLLIAIGFFNVLKGLDVEEALLAWIGAGTLWWGRCAFTADPGPVKVGASVATAAAALAVTVGVTFVAAWSAAEGRPELGLVARATGDMFLWQDPPMRVADNLRFVPQALGVVSLLGVLLAARALFRPLPSLVPLPDLAERARAADVIRRHGHDTLAFFKLRSDKHYLWSSDRRAFIGYRIESRVMLISGDPVGPRDSVHTLLAETVDHARRRDLRLAVVGASQQMRDACAEVGMKTLYIGDEAIVDTQAFGLEGRGIRKVRQSVHRLEHAGYETEAICSADATPELMDELDIVSTRWRKGAPERGFSMALDSIRGHGMPDTLLVIARAPDGHVAGFIHLVPSFGPAAMSLERMRRLPDEPNGLMEFLVVRTITTLRERDVAELSLNFAAFGQFLRAPANRFQAFLGAQLRFADRWFQIQRLQRFNAKFGPRWQPRYLVYPSVAALPRCALAVLWAEGQAPKPALRPQPTPRVRVSPGP